MTFVQILATLGTIAYYISSTSVYITDVSNRYHRSQSYTQL